MLATVLVVASDFILFFKKKLKLQTEKDRIINKSITGDGVGQFDITSMIELSQASPLSIHAVPQ